MRHPAFTSTTAMKTLPDIVCLYGARGLRGFGDGFAILILPVYLTAIGFSPLKIGMVASASLLGTAALTLITVRLNCRLANADIARPRPSAAVEAGQRRLRDGMEMQVEPDRRSRSLLVLGKGQLVDVHGENRDLIAMRLVAG